VLKSVSVLLWAGLFRHQVLMQILVSENQENGLNE